MGVYIKGMEMPKVEFGSVIVAIRPDGMVEDVMGCYVGKAVPVPPHGDLIDRKALLEGEGRYLISLCKEGIDVEEILRAKTVIPASKEE